MKQGFPVCDVALPAWPGCTSVAAPVTVALPDGLTPVRPVPSQHKATHAFLLTCCNIMIALESDLNALDAKSGDGDTGSTLAGAARALIPAMDHLPLADHTQPYRAIGLELSQTMGGSSGILHVGLGGAPPHRSRCSRAMVLACRRRFRRFHLAIQVGNDSLPQCFTHPKIHRVPRLQDIFCPISRHVFL